MTRILAALGLFSLAMTACSRVAGAPDFTLRDDRGSAWHMSAQRGKALAITFGFSHCLDTCPATLAKLERVTQLLGDRSKDVELVLITVDPLRDTPDVMHRFVGRFVEPHGSELVGLTGTQAEIASVEALYHVWSQRLPGSSLHTYDVAHSAVILLIDPAGRLRGVTDDDAPPAALHAAIAQMLG